MKYKFFTFLACLAPFFGYLPLGADEMNQPVHVSSSLQKESIEPGSTFWVRIELNHEAGWHTYWKNPGDVGAATTIEWNLPVGFHVKETKWPSPKSFSDSEMDTFGYEEKTYFFTEIAVDESAQSGSYKLQATLSALACSHESCYPIDAEFEHEIAVDQEAFSQNLFSSPVASKAIEAKKISGYYHVEIPSNFLSFEPEEIAFVSAKEGKEKEAISFESVVKSASGAYAFPLAKEGKAGAQEGLLIFSTKKENKSHIAQVTFPKELSLSTSPSLLSFLLLCSLAFLGGLILNLMPCVLPVITLKILSFVNLGGENPRKVFLHGVSFTGGVLFSFWVLAASLLLLKAYGSQIGWGFQLQDPYFLSFLILFIFIFSLSMLGVFELSAGVFGGIQKKEGLFSSFFSGILATLVATPCTGPFLGPAIGASLTLPALSSLTIFTMIALGLSFPYLLLSLFPKAVRFIPKPGKWTNTFKEICGFILLLTALWLLWVFEALTSPEGVLLLLAALLAASFAAYSLRNFAAFSLPRKSRRFGYVVASFALLAACAMTYKAASNESLDTHNFAASQEAYSQEKLQSYLAQGKPVFVDFTAKWCLICQANALVIHSEEAQQAFKEKNVVVLVADWTKRDAFLTNELAKYGRGGVPLYLLFSPEKTSSPEVLPQVLTAGTIKEFVQNLPSNIATNK